MGWDEDGGFNRKIYEHEPMDDSVRDILRAAGKNPDKIDNEERKFVYQFLENQNFFSGQSAASTQSSGFQNNSPVNISSNSLPSYQPPAPQHMPRYYFILFYFFYLSYFRTQDQSYYYHHQPPLSQLHSQQSQNRYYQSQCNQQPVMRQQPPPRPPPILASQHNIETSSNVTLRVLPQVFIN